MGTPLGSTVRKMAVPGTRTGGIEGDARGEELGREAVDLDLLAEELAPVGPGLHDDEEEQVAKAATIQPPETILVTLERKKAPSIDEEEEDEGHDDPELDAPHAPREEDHEAGGHEHRRRDGDAVGVGQGARALEAEDEADRADEEEPVDEGHVDLADRLVRGVPDLDAGPEPELHALPARWRRRPEMTACEAMIVAIVARMTRGKSPQAGTRRKKRLSTWSGLARRKAPWPDVVEEEGRVDEEEPGLRMGERPKWPRSAYMTSAPVIARKTEPEDAEAEGAVARDEADRVVGD